MLFQCRQEDENLDLQPTLFQQWMGDLKGDESLSAASKSGMTDTSRRMT